MLQVVSHHVQRFPTLKPLIHCFHFSWLDNRVKVTRYKDVDLRVECGEEPPDHGEHVDGVGKEGMGQLVHRAEVEAVGGAGQVAEVGHQGVVAADVVVQPDAPAAAVVVEGGDCVEVCLDPLKVASLLVEQRLRIPVKGKGNHLLARATLPRVSRAGGSVTRFWNSGKKVEGKGLSVRQRDFYLHEACWTLLVH